MNTLIRSAGACVVLMLGSCMSGEESEVAMATQGAPSPAVTVEKTPLTVETLALARGDTEEALGRLRTELTDPAFLQRLNTEREYLALPPESLQLFFVLDGLARNPAPSARKLFGELARTPLYSVPGPYLAVVLEASVRVAEPPAGLIALWKEQLASDASELGRAVEAVVANGSAEAVELFKRALLANPYREDYVFEWLRNAVLRHRQDLNLLRACQRLLQAPNWPSRLKDCLVEVLFDYQPESWYPIDVSPPVPPSREALSGESRRLLLEIAQLARDQKRLGWRRYRAVRKSLAPG